MQFIHTTEYYSALRSKKILSHTKTTMKLDIMLYELSQSWEDSN